MTSVVEALAIAGLHRLPSRDPILACRAEHHPVEGRTRRPNEVRLTRSVRRAAAAYQDGQHDGAIASFMLQSRQGDGQPHEHTAALSTDGLARSLYSLAHEVVGKISGGQQGFAGPRNSQAC
jgi:hypothetical protein